MSALLRYFIVGCTYRLLCIKALHRLPTLREHLLWIYDLYGGFDDEVGTKYHKGGERLGKNAFHGCIAIYEGQHRSSGLVDRLRGITSVYLVCKEKGIPFRIYFVHPFPLDWFLQPNNYDWHIEEPEISRSLNEVDLIFLKEDSDFTDNMRRMARRWLTLHIKKNDKQYHCFTNIDFSYLDNFGEVFRELFKPTPRLEQSILQQLKAIGMSHISVSCRFLNLMGDFNEPNDSKPLQRKDCENLQQRVLEQIAALHEAYPQHRVLVCSDSITFLERAKQLAYTYILPGTVTHIDNTEKGSYETFEKTFLDFFLIAHAQKVFLLRTGQMYKSGFPYAASLVYARPFELIEF